MIALSTSASSALLTDLYQLTMAYGYWKLGRAEEQAVYSLFFRSHPFKGGYTVAAGLADVAEYLRAYRFDESDVMYLAELRGHDGAALFDAAFLDYLQTLRLTCDVDAVAEGTVVFPHEPLVQVRGSILQCQLLETALLNLVNFPTLIATKAARICEVARGDDVLEFGLRRSQGAGGAMTAARAAYIGGCSATSNVLAGKVLGIPVRGTHAHSWVMSFDDEPAAFAAYAECMPNNCVFLVDTYDTLEGVRHAIDIGRRLRDRGRRLLGIRLDSGDLAHLSIEARKLLDAAGFTDAAIVASNDLDEHLITSLKQQGAQISVWGVGTRLVTGWDQPALGGVYKLSATREADGSWRPRIKLSEQYAKISTPGVLAVRRYRHDDRFVADAIYDVDLGLTEPVEIVHPGDETRRKLIPEGATHEELLQPVMRGGRMVWTSPSLHDIRRRTLAQLQMLHPTIRRLDNPHAYPAGLERRLHERKLDMVMQARKRSVKEAV